MKQPDLEFITSIEYLFWFTLPFDDNFEDKN